MTLCTTSRDKLLKVKNQSSNLESILEERSHNTNALWAKNERNSAISQRSKHHLPCKVADCVYDFSLFKIDR